MLNRQFTAHQSAFASSLAFQIRIKGILTWYDQPGIARMIPLIITSADVSAWNGWHDWNWYVLPSTYYAGNALLDSCHHSFEASKLTMSYLTLLKRLKLHEILFPLAFTTKSSRVSNKRGGASYFELILAPAVVRGRHLSEEIRFIIPKGIIYRASGLFLK